MQYIQDPNHLGWWVGGHFQKLFRVFILDTLEGRGFPAGQKLLFRERFKQTFEWIE